MPFANSAFETLVALIELPMMAGTTARPVLEPVLIVGAG